MKKIYDSIQRVSAVIVLVLFATTIMVSQCAPGAVDTMAPSLGILLVSFLLIYLLALNWRWHK